MLSLILKDNLLFCGYDKFVRVYQVQPFKGVGEVPTRNRLTLKDARGTVVTFWDGHQTHFLCTENKEISLQSSLMKNVLVCRDSLFAVAQSCMVESESHVAVSHANKVCLHDKKSLHATSDSVFAPSTMVHAHESDVACMAITRDVLATVSQSGTTIHLFDMKGNLRQKLRRGIRSASVFSLDIRGNWLLAASSSTVHVFRIDLKESVKGWKARVFDPSWAHAQFTLLTVTTAKAAFDGDNTFVVATVDGDLFRVAFDETEAGKCTMLSHTEF